jgi:spermidine synthase
VVLTANVWWTEQQTSGMRLGLRCTGVVATRQSPYQSIAIYETAQYGRLLALDDVVMTTEADEFVYHEMLAHPALTLCERPRRVLVVGGGDGGCVREVCRHPEVQRVVLAELDGDVIAICREHLPSIAAGLADPRVEVQLGDGAAYLAATPPGTFDVILVDAPDPVGPAEGLFTADFYRHAAAALAPGGVLAAQSESPFLHRDLIRRVQGGLRRTFPTVRLYWAVVPTYPGGMWTFSLAIRGPWPARPRPVSLPCRYWSPQIQDAAFVAPPFMAELMEPGS